MFGPNTLWSHCEIFQGIGAVVCIHNQWKDQKILINSCYLIFHSFQNFQQIWLVCWIFVGFSPPSTLNSSVMWLALWSLCLIFKIYAHWSIKFDLNLYFNYEFEEEKLNLILRHTSWYMNILSLIHSKGIFRKIVFPYFRRVRVISFEKVQNIERFDITIDCSTTSVARSIK